MYAPLLYLAILLVPYVSAAVLFEPLFGIKFKENAAWMMLFYAVLSTIVAVLAIFAGGFVLVATFWAALGGGAGAVSGFVIFCASFILIGSILANLAVLNMFNNFPKCYECRSFGSALLACTLVVALQGAAIYFVLAQGQTARDGANTVTVPFGQKAPRLLFGYIDRTGKFAIAPAYGEAEKFHEGRAVVWPANATTEFVGDNLALPHYDTIDKSGKVVGSITEGEHIQLREKYKYTNPEDYFESAAGNSLYGVMARQSGYQEYHGIKSDIVEHPSEGISTRPNNNYHREYIDMRGNKLFKQDYFDCLRFTEGLAAVSVNVDGYDKWGYINKDGVMVISPRFDKAAPFHEGLAVVGLNNPKADGRYGNGETGRMLWGYIDQKGNIVIPPVFLHAYSFSEGLAAVRIDANNKPDLKASGVDFSAPEGKHKDAAVDVSALERKHKDAAVAQKKDLASFAVRCTQSWRDLETWTKTAAEADNWMRVADSLNETGRDGAQIKAIQAAIDTISNPVRLAEAERLAGQAITADPSNALAHAVMGHCLTSRRSDKAAIEQFNVAIKLEPKNIEWYACRGLVYENLNDNDRAIADYTKMIELQPRAAWGYGSRAHALLGKEQSKPAIEDANRALAVDPHNVFALKQIADAQMRLNHCDQSLVALARAEPFTPKVSGEMVELLNMRATAYLCLGKKAEAAAVQKEMKTLNDQLNGPR